MDRKNEWPQEIPVESRFFSLALHFGKKPKNNRYPLYLANLTGHDLADVVVSSYGIFTFGDKEARTSDSIKEIGLVKNGSGRFIEEFDEFFDAESTVYYTITAMLPDGVRYSGQANTLGIPFGIPDSRWIKVKDWQPLTGGSDNAA